MTMKNITKRDGRLVPFDAAKIESAILKSFEEEGRRSNPG